MAAGCDSSSTRAKAISDQGQRLEFDGFTILPPKERGWVRLDPPPRANPHLIARVYFVKTLTKEGAPRSELHRLTAVVRTGDVVAWKVEKRGELLETIARSWSGSCVGKCLQWDCVQYGSTTADPDDPRFVIDVKGFIVQHPDSPALTVNVEYRQYHGRDVQPLSAEVLEREVEPFHKSLELTPRHVQVRPPASWASEMDAGAKAAAEQRWSDAESAFRAALNEAERFFTPQDPRLAQALYSLGNAYQRQGRQAEAEPLYRRALAIYEQRPEADPRRHGQALHDLGYLYWQQGQHERAEALLRQALSVREASFGPDDLDVGQSLSVLGDFYHHGHRWAEAESVTRRALPVYERARGPNDQRVGWLLHLLGHILDAQGRVAEAEPLLRRGLTIAEKVFGANHREVAEHMTTYSGVLRKLGRQSEADDLDARAKAVRASVNRRIPACIT
jgi:tetratricopeptide (TPR) repeat protein